MYKREAEYDVKQSAHTALESPGVPPPVQASLRSPRETRGGRRARGGETKQGDVVGHMKRKCFMDEAALSMHRAT